MPIFPVASLKTYDQVAILNNAKEDRLVHLPGQELYHTKCANFTLCII